MLTVLALSVARSVTPTLSNTHHHRRYPRDLARRNRCFVWMTWRDRLLSDTSPEACAAVLASSVYMGVPNAAVESCALMESELLRMYANRKAVAAASVGADSHDAAAAVGASNTAVGSLRGAITTTTHASAGDSSSIDDVHDGASVEGGVLTLTGASGALTTPQSARAAAIEAERAQLVSFVAEHAAKDQQTATCAMMLFLQRRQEELTQLDSASTGRAGRAPGGGGGGDGDGSMSGGGGGGGGGSGSASSSAILSLHAVAQATVDTASAFPLGDDAAFNARFTTGIARLSTVARALSELERLGVGFGDSVLPEIVKLMQVLNC
jgi:hypothetical protein